MLENFGKMTDSFICPNLTEFALFTPDWADFDVAGLNALIFSVKVNSGYEDMAKQTYIRSCYSYPYYQPNSSQTAGGTTAWTNDIHIHSYYSDQTN